SFQPGFFNYLIEHLKEEFAGDLKLRQRDIEIDVVAVIAKLHANWWASVTIPVSPMTDGPCLQPDGATLHDAMKIVQDMWLVGPLQMVQIVQEDEGISTREIDN